MAILPVPFALAAMPPRKNIGTATRPGNPYKFKGCPHQGANPSMVRVAGDPP
ncbi:hypothetical protein OKW46_001377 [Paraburkholderia sp. WSM4179]|nr:hypothetical protein [Paraburkholderia sp. WSM4179]